MGLIIAGVVTAANVDDCQGLRTLMQRYVVDGVKRLRKIWVDGGDQSGALQEWVGSLKQTHKIDVDITDHEGKGFQVVAWRGVVERPFSWLLNDRRHSRDYERLRVNSEAMIQISMIHLLIKRLA